MSCTNSSSSSGTVSESERYANEQTEALYEAQKYIRLEFAADASFQGDASIEETNVSHRYKIMQRFDSNEKDGYNFVYRIWVQKFPTGWEYGNLAIENASGNRLLTINGHMKEYEQREMNKVEQGTASGVDYEIIKRNAPNYVLVYTPSRLERDDILAVYNNLKAEYQSVKFTKNRNPDADDYLEIQSGMVFEFDIDKITSLSKY